MKYCQKSNTAKWININQDLKKCSNVEFLKTYFKNVISDLDFVCLFDGVFNLIAIEKGGMGKVRQFHLLWQRARVPTPIEYHSRVL